MAVTGYAHTTWERCLVTARRAPEGQHKRKIQNSISRLHPIPSSSLRNLQKEMTKIHMACWNPKGSSCTGDQLMLCVSISNSKPAYIDTVQMLTELTRNKLWQRWEAPRTEGGGWGQCRTTQTWSRGKSILPWKNQHFYNTPVNIIKIGFTVEIFTTVDTLNLDWCHSRKGNKSILHISQKLLD